MKRTCGLVSAVCALVLAGCGSNDSGSNGTGGSAGSAGTGGGGGSAGMPADGGSTVTISGVVNEVAITGDAGATTSPLAGVAVCWYQHAEVPCVTTGTDGKYVLPGIASNTEGALTFNKTGYVGTLSVGTTGVDDIVDRGTNMVSVTTTSTVFALIGDTFTAGTSNALGATVAKQLTVDGGISYQGIAGATFAIAPASGHGPYYYAANGFPDKTLTQTSTFADALFDNLDAGDIEVTVTPPSGFTTCTRLEPYGWASTKANTLRMPVIAGYAIIGASFACQ